MKLKRIIGKLFGFFGLGYCSKCGRKLKIIGTKGYYGDPIYYCSRCRKKIW